MVRGGSEGIASPYRTVAQFWRYPFDLPDGAGAIAQGLENRQEPLGAAFVGLPYPSPRRGFKASGRRFGRVPAVAPMARGRPAGNREPGRGQVRRR